MAAAEVAGRLFGGLEVFDGGFPGPGDRQDLGGEQAHAALADLNGLVPKRKAHRQPMSPMTARRDSSLRRIWSGVPHSC